MIYAQEEQQPTLVFGTIEIVIILIAVTVLVALVAGIVYFVFVRRSKNKTPVPERGNVPETPRQHLAPNVKRCPACQSTYTDQTLKFCLTDGTPLESGDDDYETVVRRA